MIESILTVTVAATTYDLVDLRNVREELSITDTSSDSKLQRWIEAESARFANACGRVFPRETLSETFSFDTWADWYARRPDDLVLTRWPVASITSVTEDDGTALASSYYECNPDAGLLYRLDGSGYRTCWTATKIVMVYVAGYSTIPADVQDAVITLVRRRWHSSGRDPALRALTVDGVGSKQFWIGGAEEEGDMPPEVQAVANRYRERRV